MADFVPFQVGDLEVVSPLHLRAIMLQCMEMALDVLLMCGSNVSEITRAHAMSFSETFDDLGEDLLNILTEKRWQDARAAVERAQSTINECNVWRGVKTVDKPVLDAEAIRQLKRKTRRTE